MMAEDHGAPCLVKKVVNATHHVCHLPRLSLKPVENQILIRGQGNKKRNKSIRKGGEKGGNNRSRKRKMKTRQSFYFNLLLLVAAPLLQSSISDAFVNTGSSRQNVDYSLISSSSSTANRIDERQSIFTFARKRKISKLDAVAKSGGIMIETEDQYNKVVLATNIQKPALVLFSAPWCGPCRLTNPVVKEVMKQYTGKIDVYEICTDDLAEIAEEEGIMSIPTIQLYYGGKALDTIVGCVAKTVLANAVEKVLDDIKQEQQQQ